MDKILQALAIEQAAMPGVLMLLSIIKAHTNASKGQFPTEDEILAAIPIDQQSIKDLWARWSTTHP